MINNKKSRQYKKMKLSEITKKEFLNTLKDPNKTRIQKKIKQFRKAIVPLGWQVYSNYDANESAFNLIISNNKNIYTDEDKILDIISNIFPRPVFNLRWAYGRDNERSKSSIKLRIIVVA